VRAVRRRLAGVLAAGVLQLVALVLAHDLVFLARYGSRYGEELIHTGHGGTWSSAVLTSLILGAVLAGVGVVRLVNLRVLLRGRTAVDHRSGPLRVETLFHAWRRIGPRLALSTVVILSIQENVERAAIGRPMPGPAVLLTPEYAGGLWIALAVGLAIGLVVALFHWRRQALLARLRASRLRAPRTTLVAVRRPGIAVRQPAESLLGRRSALRAPPRAIAS
jgi:hypothetical protein